MLVLVACEERSGNLPRGEQKAADGCCWPAEASQVALAGLEGSHRRRGPVLDAPRRHELHSPCNAFGDRDNLLAPEVPLLERAGVAPHCETPGSDLSLVAKAAVQALLSLNGQDVLNKIQRKQWGWLDCCGIGQLQGSPSLRGRFRDYKRLQSSPGLKPRTGSL
uniref:Uncharacterized protein n=1 Tax=Sphaerodactylus townsendi TaxID=933632 RepID=A0ACB8FV65_9SAUR